MSANPPDDVTAMTGERTLAAGLRRLCSDGKIADVKLAGTDGVQIAATRCILAARSPVFESMFFGNFSEAQGPGTVVKFDYSSKVLRSVVEYCCTDEAAILKTAETTDDESLVENIVYLADAANFFDLPTLKEKTEDHACSLISTTPTLACTFLMECIISVRSGNKIEKCALRTMRSNPSKTLLDGDAVKVINEPVLQVILTDKKIRADELTMFRVLQAWANGQQETVMNNNTESRQDIATRLSKHICLEQISPSDLSNIVRPSGLVTKDQLLQAYEAQAFKTEQQKTNPYKRLRSRGPAVWESSGCDTFSSSSRSWLLEENSVGTIQRDWAVRSGVWKWSVKVLEVPTSSTVWIGVISTAHSISKSQWLVNQRGNWMYGSSGKSGFAHPSEAGERTPLYHPNHPTFSKDSVVTLTLDLRQSGTLDAVVDGGESFQLFRDMLSEFDESQDVGFLLAVQLLNSPARVQILEAKEIEM